MILVKSKQFDGGVTENKQNEKFISLIDFQPDYREMTQSTGELNKIKIKEHYLNTINLLKKMKKTFNKEIVICIHPLYDLKRISKIYKGFKVVKLKTKEFIEKSFIVMFYDSSSVVDAIILKKKIIALNSDLFFGKKHKSSSWTDIIHFKEINISKKLEINKKSLILELDKKLVLYDKYLNKFASNDQKEDGSNKIIRIIKEKFFINKARLK